MRIIGGIARGRRLQGPAGTSTRPTAARVREALFSILGPPSADAVVLDLFAGAGTLGIEALSRGAGRAVFVEKERKALQCLRKNIEDLGFAENSKVIAGALPAITKRLRNHGPFTWVFLDPPYASPLAQSTLERISELRLADDATIVVEHDGRNLPPERTDFLVKIDHRRYGDSELSLYRRSETP